MSGGPVFVLGVGAQKAGTTWLHDLLSRQSGAAFGPMKEYHVLDRLDRPAPVHLAATLRARLLGRECSPLTRGFKSRDLRGYVGFFRDLVTQQQARITGDITPAYATLSAQMFETIGAELRAAGFRPRVIFVMRDPVERCWSAVRMHRKEPHRHRSARPLGAGCSEAEHLSRRYAEPAFAARTDYRRTVQALRRAFAPEELFLALFETLFHPSTLDALSGFLGMTLEDAHPGRRINVSPKGAALPPDLAQAIARHYRDAYAFGAEEFGVAEIARYWPSGVPCPGGLRA